MEDTPEYAAENRELQDAQQRMVLPTADEAKDKLRAAIAEYEQATGKKPHRVRITDTEIYIDCN